MTSTSLQQALASIGGNTHGSIKPKAPTTPPTTPTLFSSTSTASAPKNGLFEASFTGLDLSESGIVSNNQKDATENTTSASQEYLQWKQKQRDIIAQENIEEQRINTRVNYMLANKNLEKILITSNEKQNQPDYSEGAKLGSIPHVTSSEPAGLANLGATLAFMHGHDVFGAKKESIGKRTTHKSIHRTVSAKVHKNTQSNGGLKNRKNAYKKPRRTTQSTVVKKKSRSIKH